MVASTQFVKDDDLIRKIWGKYLHNGWKYDKYGALGKILLIEEVLNENKTPSLLKRDSSAAYQLLINEIFPRTFSCEHQGAMQPALAAIVNAYFDEMSMELRAGGVSEDILRSIAIGETAEHFCLAVKTVEGMVRATEEEN